MQKDRSYKDEIHRAFRRSESQLRKALRRRKAEVKVVYLFFIAYLDSFTGISSFFDNCVKLFFGKVIFLCHSIEYSIRKLFRTRACLLTFLSVYSCRRQVVLINHMMAKLPLSQLAFTCSKLIIETVEQSVKYLHLVTPSIVFIVNFEHVIAG